MAKKAKPSNDGVDDPDAKQKLETAHSEDANQTLGGLNPPDIDPATGKPTKMAIENFAQAASLAKRLYDRARTYGRIEVGAVILEKYGGAAPYRHADLEASAQLWRNNFSTNPLASIVDRTTPQLKDPIEQTEFLTYSSLKNSLRHERPLKKG